MEIKNHKLQDVAENITFHQKSDGVFMPEEYAFNAHNTMPRLNWALDAIKSNGWKTMLDVGCKDGYLCLTASRMGIEAKGIDPSIDAIAEANRKAEKTETRPSFEAVSIEDFMSDKRFDVVVMLEVIDRLVDVDAVMIKVANYSDNVLISTPCYYGRFGFDDKKRNLDRIRIYKEHELKEAIKGWGFDASDMLIVDGAFLVKLTKQGNGK